MSLASPIDPHGSTPADLKARIEAERLGRPFLIYRDGLKTQRIFTLPDQGEVLIGRRLESDVPLEWDKEASRVHARLERLAGDWTIEDDGLSRNGSWVNGDRLTARRRLCDGDALRLGNTVLVYIEPGDRESDVTISGSDQFQTGSLTDTQRRILIALARPYKDQGEQAVPATNKEIADEVFLSVDAVKGHLRVLFQKFGVEDLPQNKKRAHLVWRAFRSGAISATNLWE